MLASELERCQICAEVGELQPTSLFGMLRDEYLDATRSLMHEVLFVAQTTCTPAALAALAATDHWNREQLQPLMSKLHYEHNENCAALLSSLGCLHRSQLQDLRAITIADGLPKKLQTLLGTWLRESGCLSCVHCLRCESWWRRGDLPWIELAPLRSGEPEGLSLEERFTLDRFDTEDGLLKTIIAQIRP